MDQSIYVQLVAADPVIALKSGLRFIHFIGLALGLGAATLLDLMLLRYFLKLPITSDALKIFHFSTRLVNVGLAILWVTGISFIIHYAAFEPEKLLNGKIWAKLSIVGALTVNGMFIHWHVLPRLDRQVGKSLFDGMSDRERHVFQISAAVSVTSWYVPVVLGAFPQLNFTVPATTILSSWVLLVVIVALAMNALLAVLVRPKRTAASVDAYVPGIYLT